MLSAPACSTRLTIAVVVASTITLFALFFTLSESFSQTSLEYAHKAQNQIGSIIHSDPVPASKKVYDCEDPYRRPGYLYIDPEDYKGTRWIPYTSEFLEAEAPPYAQYPAPISEGEDISFNVTGVEESFLNATANPKQWMRVAVAENKRRREASSVVAKQQTAEDFLSTKDEGGLGWLWGRRVLMLGDSVDRFMMQFFCEEFGQRVREAKQHTTSSCSIPSLNLTLVHWHFPGGWTYRPDWWWMTDMQEIAFEERWETHWAPTLDTHVRGPEGRPDLLLWQAGLWDQRAMWEAGQVRYGEAQGLGVHDRHLVWQEVRFVAARIGKLVARLNAEFGPDVPAMFRAITVHRSSDAADANLYELERISRAIAENAGHETFEWGRIITAFSMLYKDKTHTGKGPGSWLWGDMVLEYLARGAGAGDPDRSPYFDGWDACHSQLVTWGGR